MAHESKIEWTEATWNPFHGCHKVSQGCKNCYMFRDKARFGQDPNVVVRAGDKTFYAPLKWTEPRTIFTCSWSDFFIEEADAWRDEAFAIMALTPQHTYQVLTKRPQRMLEYFADPETPNRIASFFAMPDGVDGVYVDEMPEHYQQFSKQITAARIDEFPCNLDKWPLPNVHLGVSVEDQKTADERIPLLLNTPAAVRWLSIEPLLGPVNLTQFPVCDGVWANYLTGRDSIDDGREVVHKGVPVQHNKIDWCVVGGESGPDARPMHPDWVRSIRDQCTAAGVPFFFKQWGEWLPVLPDAGAGDPTDFQYKHSKQHSWDDFKKDMHSGDYSLCVGKKKAGRMLDGRTWDEMPEVLK